MSNFVENSRESWTIGVSVTHRFCGGGKNGNAAPNLYRPRRLCGSKMLASVDCGRRDFQGYWSNIMQRRANVRRAPTHQQASFHDQGIAVNVRRFRIAWVMGFVAFAALDLAAIRAVLDDSSDPKAKSADPNRFYDNALVEAVNREYAAKLFPGEMR